MTISLPIFISISFLRLSFLSHFSLSFTSIFIDFTFSSIVVLVNHSLFVPPLLICLSLNLSLPYFLSICLSRTPAGDGNVSFEEFVDILSNMTYEDKSGLSSADQEERELRDAFRVFDKHNRGYITASDLRAVLQCLGEDLDEEDSKLPTFCAPPLPDRFR